MTYKEEIKDLFSLTNENYYFVQCISADFIMDKDIAAKFNEYFNTNTALAQKYDNYISIWNNTVKQGFCIKQGRTLNLVIKKNCWDDSTYEIMQNALNKLRDIVIMNDIHKIAMPIVGCEIDKLDWNIVSQMIQNTFKDINIEIFICRI